MLGKAVRLPPGTAICRGGSGAAVGLTWAMARYRFCHSSRACSSWQAQVGWPVCSPGPCSASRQPGRSGRGRHSQQQVCNVKGKEQGNQ